MNAKLYSLTMTAILWCVSLSKAETPWAHLQTPFTGINQQAFIQGKGFDFGLNSLSSYSGTRYATPRTLIPNEVFIRQKAYQIPLEDNLQAVDPGLTTEETFGEHQHEPANYEFQYNIQDAHEGTQFGHKEFRDGHVTKGQYTVLLPDGRKQIVDYIADEHGYRPTIRYEYVFANI